MRVNVIIPELIVENNQQAFDRFLHVTNFQDEKTALAALSVLIESMMDKEITPLMAQEYLKKLELSAPHICDLVGFGISLAFQAAPKPLNYLFNAREKNRTRAINKLKVQLRDRKRPIEPSLNQLIKCKLEEIIAANSQKRVGMDNMDRFQ
ncbi:hypothetical protein EN12_24425 [Vibrio cholerae]|uniref:Uncharacterized protein n=1 Tax=Vibrio cholerae TaxID=666 RepID=A0A5B1C236_VIBCL|nr:hypothetical protein [Vibrio cholerae]AKO78238.1 hypothetical protein EN12_24425 [Vibrio cholerae]KAA1254756.1 hypothetical protein F0M16_10845 [Vibrio cholerae]